MVVAKVSMVDVSHIPWLACMSRVPADARIGLIFGPESTNDRKLSRSRFWNETRTSSTDRPSLLAMKSAP